MILLLIILSSLFVRIYLLDSLPGEMWGDVIEHYKLAQWIQDGHYFLNYKFGGDGPIFSYILALGSFLYGLDFYSMKLTTVIIGTLLTIVIYFLTLEFFKKKEIAYIASFVSTVSFWSLSFSRQAKPHILIPLFVSLIILYILKKKYLLSGTALAIGMFTQASFWTMPITFLTNRKLAFVGLISIIPFLYQSLQLKHVYLANNSFYEEKLALAENDLISFTYKVLWNFIENILSLNLKGDNSFRHTISGQPHLDAISGIFFLLGFLLIIIQTISKKDRKFLLYFIFPFFTIQIPSILDVNNPLSVPNMGRMIGILPFVFMSIAYGIYTCFNYILKMVKPLSQAKVISTFFLTLVLASISFISLWKYFFVYPLGLPNKNIPFGKIIASYIKESSIEKYVVVGCCWGDWGQPEPGSIKYSLRQTKDIKFFEADDNMSHFSCNDLYSDYKDKSVAIIVNPHNIEAIEESKKCFKGGVGNWLIVNDLNVAWVIEGRI